MDLARMLEKHGRVARHRGAVERACACACAALRASRSSSCIARRAGKHAPGRRSGQNGVRDRARGVPPPRPLVALVDALKARSGQTSGYVVVTTEFENRPWESYRPFQVQRRRRRARARSADRPDPPRGRRPLGHVPQETSCFPPALQKGPRLFGPPRKKNSRARALVRGTFFFRPQKSCK